MAPKSKGRYWSMKDDRLLIELSKSSLTLEAIADRFDRPPASIAKNAVRLKTSPGGRIIRTIGIARAKAKIGLQNLAYNIRRLVTLERMAAA
jgi:hypothetical protein